ncbi:hypothetical protein ALC62_08641 [Cyphomyrmex costatus]|uniref:Double jelly roll-like domain-containing protein n=1 Tax=Cyphomyrmex costatus TaxID=456900 RepID=A0A151IGJ3_9HYME|nr:hypothetical protein ALC62_08641 [Cyphomyrmex costatus]
MSLTFTLTGKSNVLAACYFPAVDLSNGDYELGLTDFETYHTISNVNSSNNKKLRKEDEEYPLIRANNNTMKSEIKNLLRRTLNFYNHWALSYEIFEMADILDIGGESIFDDRIGKYEFHTYNPYVNTTFGHSDEIRIPIQQQDLYTLPCESYLYVEGRLTSKEENAERWPKLGINCVAFMFEEIRYELNGSEIDRNRNVGITTLLKSYSTDFTHQMENAVFLHPVFDYDVKKLVTEDGYFNFYVPLLMLFGFREDYKRVVINARHELILIRARNDNNCIVGDAATEPKLELFKIQWRMPHVTLNEVNKLCCVSWRTDDPMVIIDCSRQNESIKSGTVDVRLEFEFKEKVPANTTAYCLIIHDRVIEYSPMSTVVRKIT